MRVLIYNGDHDMCVPHTGAEAWTRSLSLPVVDQWRPWHVQNQVRILLSTPLFNPPSAARFEIASALMWLLGTSGAPSICRTRCFS